MNLVSALIEPRKSKAISYINDNMLFTYSELRAAEQHKKELRKQCWALIKNCPWKAIKFIRQYRWLSKQVDIDLIDGKYL